MIWLHNKQIQKLTILLFACLVGTHHVVDALLTRPSHRCQPSHSRWQQLQPQSSSALLCKVNGSNENILQTLVIDSPVLQKLYDRYPYVFSYADLSPDSPETAAGRAFLATNLAYLSAGLALQWQGANTLAWLTDLCAAASFQYHYQQLRNSPEAVRFALLLDYLFAFGTIGLATVYLFQSHVSLDSTEVRLALASSIVGLTCLGLSWVYDQPKPYMLWHGLWHVFSGYAGYVIGAIHVGSMPEV